MTFRVLHVCTANICRSAMAERLMRAALPPDAPVTVASCGVQPLLGHAMDSASAHALRDLGVDAEGHVARLVTADEVQRSDLVLTATTAHRAEVVQLAPSAFRRVFTLREFTRLAAHLDPAAPSPDGDGLRERVRQTAALRGLVDLPPAGGDEIGDPFAGPYELMAACASMIDKAVHDSVVALGLTAPDGEERSPAVTRVMPTPGS